jgi:hypothetical protein
MEFECTYNKKNKAISTINNKGQDIKLELFHSTEHLTFGSVEQQNCDKDEKFLPADQTKNGTSCGSAWV